MRFCHLRHTLPKLTGACLLFTIALSTLAVAVWAEEPVQLAEKDGVSGGVAVLIDGDSAMAESFVKNGRRLVHVLVKDDAACRRLRDELQERGMYGKVCVDVLRDGALPYSDRLVGAVVVTGDEPRIAAGEIERVLRPGGCAIRRDGNGWTVTQQRWPETIDEWTHYMHGADGNAVGRDQEVAEPKGIRWNAGPRWNRHHGQLAGTSGMVTAKGRLFTVLDEGPTAHSKAPAQWRLVARDAFSGVRLWDRRIESWHTQFRGFRTGPAHLTRNLVADKDRLFATLSYRGPINVLDAATGEVRRTLDATNGTQEIVHHDNVLYVVTGKERDDEEKFGRNMDLANRTSLLAVDPGTGEVLWKRDANGFELILPMTLAVTDAAVQTRTRLFCLDPKTGKERWSLERPAFHVRSGWSTPTVLIVDDVLLVADRNEMMKFRKSDNSRYDNAPKDWLVWNTEPNECRGAEGVLLAVDLASGKKLWSTPCAGGFSAPADVFWADGLVWVGADVMRKKSDFTTGHDLHTGKVKRTITTDDAFPQNHHHRCYRPKATERFIVLGRTGTEFIDLSGNGANDRNTWLRGTCQYGVLPANGLVYTPPHACACYPEGKLAGLWALAPSSNEAVAVPDEQRLTRFAAAVPGRDPAPTDWPTYRNNSRRSGASNADPGGTPKQAWECAFTGRISAPVIANGIAYVAEIDAHTVHAVSMETGTRLWQYTVGARVDSPPTVHRGHIYFGSADGRAHCLGADDGQPVWSFLAAPNERKIVSYGQLESPWPVHGSVLVHGGSVWIAAGRSSYLDGGLAMWRLDPLTGKIQAHARIDHGDVETGLKDELKPGTRMIGALNDVLCAGDDATVFLRHNHFDKDFGKLDPTWHLYSANGYLDDSWFSRSYWIYGMRMWGEYKGWPVSTMYVPYGRILSMDADGGFYGFQRPTSGRNALSRTKMEGSSKHELFHATLDKEKAERDMPPEDGYSFKRQGKGDCVSRHWNQTIPIWVRAMAVTSDRLVIAGPVEPRRGEETAAALAGEQGSRLMLIAKKDGKILADLELAAPPAWDGLAVVPGRIVISGIDGKLRCFTGAQ